MRISPISNTLTNSKNNLKSQYSKDNVSHQYRKEINFQSNKQRALDFAKPFAFAGIILTLLAEHEQMSLGALMGSGFSFAAMGAIIGNKYDKIKEFVKKQINELDESENN